MIVIKVSNLSCVFDNIVRQIIYKYYAKIQ